jgi:hypothetical protein
MFHETDRRQQEFYLTVPLLFAIEVTRFTLFFKTNNLSSSTEEARVYYVQRTCAFPLHTLVHK